MSCEQEKCNDTSTKDDDTTMYMDTDGRITFSGRDISPPSNNDDWPYVTQLESDLTRHGEVHITVEEFSAEIEARSKTTTFDYERGVMSISGQNTTHRFAMDSIIHWYKPKTVFHEGSQ